MDAQRTIRIGNGCGFWGDSVDAPFRLVRDGQLDYLTLEYLAELTMSILARQRAKSSSLGYARDFLDTLHSIGPFLKANPQLKIVTNAGGLNARAMVPRIQEILGKIGISRKIGIVEGDDLLPTLDAILASGERLEHLDSKQPLCTIRDRVVAANAYLGARPIVDLLQQGAEIVVSGRVADASLTVAPAVFEFGWDWQDWDRLAGATLAGHLIECGAQVTGGLYSRWEETAATLAEIGYPFVDIAADATFTVGKPDGSGGILNAETIAEQMLYEVEDPTRYFTPDVVADFTSAKLSHRTLSVTKGMPATPFFKVSIAYRAGFSASGTLVVAGPNAVEKARACGRIVLERLRREGITLARTNVEVLGAGATAPGTVTLDVDPPEVVLRISAHDSNELHVERFTKEFAPLVTSGPPGITGYTSGRPQVREVFAYWPSLIRKDIVPIQTTLFDV